jgi:glycerol kinase
MAFQTRDLAEAMSQDAGLRLKSLKVDGGASVNDALLQFQADILDVTVQRPVVAETTALGAAYLAGLAVGYWRDLSDVTNNWALDREFHSQMGDEDRAARYDRWKRAVDRTLAWESQ